MLTCAGLQKTIAGRVILRNVCLQVDTGRALAVLGPSGVGKSVLLESLAFLQRPDSGSIMIDGARWDFGVSGELPPAPWPSVAMMFQSLALWPHLTLYENIVFPFAHLADSARRNRLAMEFAADLDLTGSLHTRAAQASGGERQRAAFIRVLAADPRILLLDEPTSHLDGRLTRKVMALIEQQKERGKTVVLSTHAGAFAKEVCSEMVLLRGESEPLYGDRAISDAELN